MNTLFTRRVLLTLSLLITITGQTQAQVYTSTDLGAGEANAINSADQVVGDNLNGVAVLWNGTTETTLGTLGHWDVATGINNDGQVVGYFECGCGNYHAAQWLGGLGSSLQKYNGALSKATGVNGAGDASGYVYQSTNPKDKQAVVWNGSKVVVLDKSNDYGSSVATAINDQSQAVGYFSDGKKGYRTEAVIWNGTTATILGGLTKNAASAALAINDQSQVAGYSRSNHVTQAVLWNGTTATALKSLGGTMSEADGINNAGDAVGYSYTFGNVLKQAVLWENGKVIDLNNFLSASEISAGWVFENATAISNDGTIVGDAINTNTGKEDAIVLRIVSAVSEPQTWMMLAAGLGLISLALRRRDLKSAFNSPGLSRRFS